jgi:hypothetical protein
VFGLQFGIRRRVLYQQLQLRRSVRCDVPARNSRLLQIACELYVLRGTRAVNGSDRPSGTMDRPLRFPAAERWATAVVAAVHCERDPRTLALWARDTAVSRGALRTWCHAARVAPGVSLDFSRLLRAICRTPHPLNDPLLLLDVVDPRTLNRLLASAGLTPEELRATTRCPTRFLRCQRLVSDPLLLVAVERALVNRIEVSSDSAGLSEARCRQRRPAEPSAF